MVTKRVTELEGLFFAYSEKILAILDREGRIVDANRSWLDHLGYSPQDVVGSALVDHVHPEDRGELASVLKEVSGGDDRARRITTRMPAQAERKVVYTQWRFVHHDDHVLAFGLPFPRPLWEETKEGRVWSAIGVTVVTILVAEAIARYLGSAHDLQRVAILIPLAGVLIVAARWGLRSGLMSGSLGGIYAVWFFAVYGTGETLVESLTIGILLALFMLVMAGLLGSFRTKVERSAHQSAEAETARRKATEEVRRYAKRLRDSNEELARFASIASHDLQEPLGVIRSYIQLIERRLGGDVDEHVKKDLHFVTDSAERMQRLIDDLLEYSRVESRGRRPTANDADAAARRALDILDRRIIDAKAEIEVGPLPVVMADEGQLERLFQNLFSNALKYRRPDVPVRISVRAVPIDEGTYRLELADNGIGIAPEHHERVFDIFHRLHGRGEFEGTGIGLAVCKKIVERHGGRIWVESVPGEGTTVHFTLKAAGPDTETGGGRGKRKSA
ncbi:MAG: PAS domain S-box protein [Euryarchaeota archaeon]|nr:PAS domain S-box protein [Euryarchaeota archaeon]